MRKAAKRDGNEGEIVTALRQRGASVIFLNLADAPDLLVGFTFASGNSTMFLIEVKGPKGKLRPGQITWAKNWKGPPVKVIRNIEEVYELLKDNDSKKQTIDMSELPQNFYWGKAKCLLF